MLSFRDMTAQDLACVTKLEAEASEHPWKTRHFEDSLGKPGYVCCVATLNEEPVGHGVLMTAADEAHLLIITINKLFQGKGYGKRLLQHLVGKAREKACTLFLEVRTSNEAAFSLYLNEGLSEIGRRRNYYPATEYRPAEDAIIMALDLSV